jgi:hypothetical protein
LIKLFDDNVFEFWIKTKERKRKKLCTCETYACLILSHCCRFHTHLFDVLHQCGKAENWVLPALWNNLYYIMLVYHGMLADWNRGWFEAVCTLQLVRIPTFFSFFCCCHVGYDIRKWDVIFEFSTTNGKDWRPIWDIIPDMRNENKKMRLRLHITATQSTYYCCHHHENLTENGRCICKNTGNGKDCHDNTPYWRLHVKI